MALTKVTGQVIKNTTDVTVGVLTVTNTLAVGGTVSIGGTLTYEDVTNVDAVGLITARDGIKVGSGITLSVDGDIFATGIVTATSFVGNGAVTINNNGTSKIITGSGTANTLNAKSNLTFDNTSFLVGSGVTLSKDGDVFAVGVSSLGTGSDGGVELFHHGVSRLTAASYGVAVNGDILLSDALVHIGDTDTRIRFPAADTVTVETAGSERIRIDSSGRLLLGTSTEGFSGADNLTIEDSGHCGITIRSGSDDDGQISFSDATSGDGEYAGQIVYDHTDNFMMFRTNGGNERLRIDSVGQVGINTEIPTCQLEVVNSKTKTWTPTSQTEFLVERAGNCIMSIVGNNDADCILNFGDTNDENPGSIIYDHDTDNMIFRVSAGNRAKFLTDGRFVLGAPTVNTTVDYSVVTTGRIQSDGTYDTTTGSSANVHIGTTGLLRRSTSSARYKKDITDATWGLADVLKLKPKTFKSNATGEDADDKTYAGFIAEDVHDIGLTNFVEYNSDNQPDAIHYGNMVALMAKAIQEQQEKIETLETEVAALKSS